ncbi:MAG: hypothetical protein R3D29_14725 [Nitratireductor sp.]
MVGLANSIIKRNREGKVSYPIVIAGHSVGGQEAPQFANALAKAGIPVALVIGVDPGFAPPPTFNAGSPRVIELLDQGQRPLTIPTAPAADFSGSITNINIRDFGSTVDHVGIDKDPKVQSRIISNVLAVVGR